MAAGQCRECGGLLRRSKRRLVERIFYAEAHKCAKCGTRSKTAILDFKNIRYAKCPCCKSVDLTVLKRVDKIDRMNSGFRNFVNRILGGKLYHCWFCRVQFYDTRKRLLAGREPGLNPLSMPNEDSGDVKIAS